MGKEVNKEITGTESGKEPEKEITETSIEDLVKKLERLENVKEEFIGIFGLFAALLIFTTVEIKIFNETTKFPLILGISSFFISSLMLFVLTLNNIIHPRSLRDYRSAAFVLSIIFFAFSMECFYFYTHASKLWP